MTVVGERSLPPRGFKVGQRIAWVNVPGSYASQVLVPSSKAAEVPDTLTTQQALLLQALTAQYLVAEYRDVKPGERVLVHSAAGGLGQLLVQWFKHLGAWVVGTVSSEAKAATARAAGADAVINYGHDYAFLDELMSLTKKGGVHFAIDGVGARTLSNTIKGLAHGGIAVSIGSASGPPPAVKVLELVNSCTRVAGGSCSATSPISRNSSGAPLPSYEGLRMAGFASAKHQLTHWRELPMRIGIFKTAARKASCTSSLMGFNQRQEDT